MFCLSLQTGEKRGFASQATAVTTEDVGSSELNISVLLPQST